MIGTTFGIRPAKWPATLTLLAIAIVLTVPIVVFVHRAAISPSPERWIYVFVVVLIFAGLGLLGWIYYSSRFGRFIISREGLQTKGFIMSKKIGIDEIRPNTVRIMNLKADLKMKPFVRTCGVGIFGYGEGWFRSRDWGKLLVYMTSMDDVVMIETAKNYAILLTPKNTAQFVKEAASHWGGA